MTQQPPQAKDLAFVTPILNNYMQFGPPNFRPSAKQTLFLSPIVNTIPEVMFGGRAGGGKSVALLAARLQYVHVPGYSALILRRTYQDLALPDAIMDISHKWLRGTDAKWDRETHRWTFPSGARLTFGYLDNDADVGRYKSAAFTFIAFDELTEFTQYQYTFLFSRLRGPMDLKVPWRVRSATNPGGVGHCLPYGDVLTSGGWRDIRTMKVGDPVFTVDANGKLVETVVAQVHQEHYKGALIRAAARGLRITCTPRHAVAKAGTGVRHGRNTRDGSGSPRFSLVPFEDLPGQATILRSVRWVGSPIPSVILDRNPKAHRKQPLTLGGRDLAALLGWFLSEGSLVDRDHLISIRQAKAETRERLRMLLEDRCGFHVSWQPNRANIYTSEWWEWFRREVPGKCRTKFIPQWLKDATTDELSELFYALMDGDGHWITRGKSGSYYTISRQLADDVAEVAVKLGYIVHVKQRQRPHRDGLSYEVHVKLTKSGGTELLTGHHRYDVTTTTKRRSDIDTVDYEGPVYCLGIENTHSFVVRQDGSVWVSGNSWVQERFIDTPEPNRLFIPSFVEDNPGLDPERYEKQSLSALDPVTFEQLRHGDWNVRPGGNMFKREWFRIIEPQDVPRRFARVVRYWDLAASDESKKDADYTAGCKMAYSDQTNKWYVLDMIRVRKDPGAVEALITHTAAADGPECYIRIEQEPGASSEYLMRRFRLLFGGRYPFEPVRADRKKEIRARPASSSAKAEDIVLVRGPWVSRFLNEVVAFPNPKIHDDQVDAFSGAYMMLANRNSNMDALTEGLARLAGSTIHRPIPRRW